MKKLTKTTIMLLVLVLTFMFAVFANAETTVASGTCGENLTWTLDDEGTLTISGTGAMADYTYGGPWHSKRSSVKQVIIEDGVTNIGKDAFYTDSGVTARYKFANITIPDSVTSIGESAFYSCENLISVTFGKNSNLTSIGSYAFANCTSLGEIVIENKDCQIYDSSNAIIASAVIRGHDDSTAQSYAEKYDRIFVSLDGDATDIILSGYAGDNADFTITRDGKMTITGSGNMYNYAGSTSGIPWSKYKGFIKSVSIADTITSIGSYAFFHCSQLAEITIPDSVTSIGGSAFRECTSLTSVTIPDSVTSIDIYAFSYCSSLESITIPDSVTSIGRDAFEDCDSLVNITIPGSVKEISSSAFSGCNSLVNITIPGSVTSIGDYAFEDCDSLESITILNPKCSIDNYADTISDTAVIYGYDNSTAKSYARQFNRTFVALECDHTNSTPIAAVDATCTKDGNTAGSRCNVCQVTTGCEVIPATGHAYSSQVTKQPTHEETGIEKFTCANCGDTYTETLPKLTDHAYNAVVTAPTCTEQGYTTYTCICGDTYVGDYTDANGHTDETVPGYAAKCETEGLTDGAVCAICGVVTLAQEVIPATDHSYITVGAYPATCTSTGFTGITYCSACSTVANYGESTPVAEHKMSDWIISAPATCTESGKKIKTCACGLTEEEVIPATGHKMSDWIVTSEATCTANGKKIKMCACGLTEEEVIPATGHSDADNDGICENCLLNLNPTTEQPAGTTNPFQVLIDFLNSLLEWFKNLFSLFG